MNRLIQFTLYSFVVVTICTAILTILGVGYCWFWPKDKLPYLEWLIGSVVLEIVGVALFLARRGLKYLPESITNKTPEDTLEFMKKFVTHGTAATIVSNRLSWLQASDSLRAILREKASVGIRIEIITPQELPEGFRSDLVGCHFIVTGDKNPPEARFTLVNGERSGAERLAISRGVHPDHEITIFDSNSGPQIIGMAKDIIKTAKALSGGRE